MKRLLLVVLLIVSFASRYSAAPAYADCLGPNPTATTQPSYLSAVQGVDPTHLVAIWQLSETAGTTAADSSGNAHDGTYSGPTLNAVTFSDGSPAPSFDGINDYVNIYSSGLASAFNKDEGTVFVWAKTSAWTDATIRYLTHFSADTSNRVRIFKTATNNQLNFSYLAGGTTKQVLDASLSGTSAWFSAAETWSKAADQFKAYLNGTQAGTTQTGLGTWTGSLSSTATLIGANNTGAAFFSGKLAYVVLFNSAQSSGNITTLNNVFALSATATPYPTCTPSPTLTPSNTPSPTITPSLSPTLTLTPSQTFTPSNTADVFIYWTLPAPLSTGTPVPGQIVRFDYTISAGQSAVGIALAILFFSLWAFFLIWLLMRRR